MKKPCVMCGHIKDLNCFSTRKNVHGTGTVYYKSHCKMCSVILSEEWRKDNIDEYRKYQREYHKKK
jgi:hypothetical protein